MPRAETMLIGHQRARTLLLEALASGRMHHAWLLTGPRGIGKRRFADWAALKLLSGDRDLGETPAAHPAAALFVAGSHPDHRLLAPPQEGKGSATGSILVEQMRDLGDFLHSYPALSEWRTLIVDSVDDMNPNAANAFLKELEEPRKQTLYLLVSHAPGRLLPTIRSRCRILRLLPLSDADVQAVLEQETPGLPKDTLDALAGLARGAPGSVSALAGADIAGLERTLDRIASAPDPMAESVALARSLQAQSAGPRLHALLSLVPRKLAAAARETQDPRLIDLYDEADLLARDAVRLAYVPAQVAMALADIMARSSRLQGQR